MSAIVESSSFRSAAQRVPISVARWLLVGLLLLFWQFAPPFLLDEMLVSRPTLVAGRLAGWIGDGVLIRESIATRQETAGGELDPKIRDLAWAEVTSAAAPTPVLTPEQFRRAESFFKIPASVTYEKFVDNSLAKEIANSD